LRTHKTITVFEHQRLYVGQDSFKQTHLDALLKLNEYHDGKYFEPIAKGVKFNQYVGVIQVDGITIEIHPKADKEDEDNKWKGVLIKMLKACGRLKAESSGAANVKRQHLNLLEVYFELFLLEVESLLRRGVIKKYRKQTHNTKALKGKLEFAGHIRHNAIHKERFYTTHQVYDSNHLLHQVLYKALTIVDQFTMGTRLNDLSNRVLLNFPKVHSKTITTQQINSITLNRKSSSYNGALELARLIILNYSPDISSGKEKMLSLLFDMNVLWEEYILKQLQKVCYGTAIEVSGQESKSFWGSNSLKPDVVLRKGSQTFIIDTKWKRPQNKTASISDLRQMYAYCRFWNAEKAMLLYPGASKKTSFKAFKTEDFFRDNDHTTSIIHMCKSGFVSVLDDDNKLSDTIGKQVLDLLEEDFN
jgi:5-methylcytosine-specific restriction enzyme subunit McrC